MLELCGRLLRPFFFPPSCALFYGNFQRFFQCTKHVFKPFAAATSNHTNANSMQFSSPPLLLLLVLPPLLYPLSFYAPVYLRCNVLVHVVVAALLEIQFCAAAAHDASLTAMQRGEQKQFR